MGFDPECLLNINLVPRELFCPICQQLVYPSESQQAACGHVYCQACVSYVVSNMRQCPLDGALLNHSNFKPLQDSNPLWHSTLGQVSVRCLYYRSGCSWQGELATSLAHTTNCSYGSFPVMCNRCGQQIVHRQVQEHARTCIGIASQPYASDQGAVQQQPLPNLSASNTEQQVPQQVAEVNTANYLQQQGFSGNMAEHQNLSLDGRHLQNVLSQEQQQVLAAIGQQQQSLADGRQLQNAMTQEHQVSTSTGQQPDAPQPYSGNLNYQQYYHQQQHQQNEQHRQTVPSQRQDMSLAPVPYPMQQAEQDNSKLYQQQLLQEQQRSQQHRVHQQQQQQQQQSAWGQSAGAAALQQQGQIAAVPEGAMYRQLVTALPSSQQHAGMPQYHQFGIEGKEGLSAQQPQHFQQQQMLETPFEPPPQVNQPQVYAQWESSSTQFQQHQHKLVHQPDQQNVYVNPHEQQYPEDHPENISLQNDQQQRHLARNLHPSLEYPRHPHPNQKATTHQQEMSYESSVHSQQNQLASFDLYQQPPPVFNQYEQSQHELRQKALLPMMEAREVGSLGLPYQVNGSNSHLYPSSLASHQFPNSRTFPVPGNVMREGDHKQSTRYSTQQPLSPERNAISGQRAAIENELNRSKNPRELGPDAVIPLATYIEQRQQDQRHRQRDGPQKGPLLEQNSGQQPPFLEQQRSGIHHRNWNSAQRHDMIPPMQGLPDGPLISDTRSSIEQAPGENIAMINVPGPSEQLHRQPYPEMARPGSFILSQGKLPNDGFRQFSDNLEDKSDMLGASWSRNERPLTGLNLKEQVAFAEEPESLMFSRMPLVHGPPQEKRYSEQLKHAQNLVARFGADSTDKRFNFDDSLPGRHDKNTLIGAHTDFPSEPPDFMSDRAIGNMARNYPTPNELLKIPSPAPPLQEERSISLNPVDPYKGPMGPLLRPLSSISSVPPFEDHSYKSHFPSNVQPFPPDPSVRSRLMPIQDTGRSKFDFFEPRAESQLIGLEHPGPWTRTNRGIAGRPPRSLGTRGIHSPPLGHHRAGDSLLLPFETESVRNPFADFQVHSSRPVINRGRPSFAGGRPLFFDASEARSEPPFRRALGRHELANGGPELKPMTTFTNVDSHDHGRKRKVMDSPVWCRICDVNCFSVQGLEKHSQSAEHQKIAMQLVLSIKEDDEKRTRVEEDGDKKASSDKGESPE